MRRKFVLEEGGLDTGGKDSNGECEKILVEGCDCVSAVSVIVVPLCGSLFCSLHLISLSTSQEISVSKEMNNFLLLFVCTHFCCLFTISVVREGAQLHS